MTRFRPRAQTVLEVLAALILLGPPTAVAVADLSGVGHRWFDLAAQFSAPAAVGAFAVTLGFAVLRLRTGLMAGALATALCAVAAAPQAFPDRRPAAEAPAIRLYSANLYVGNDDVAAIEASVKEARPDVVILIEASDAVGDALDRILIDHPHRSTTPRSDWNGRGSRTVIASRWPINSSRDAAGVHAPTAVVRTPLGPIEVTSAHLTRPWPYQVQWEQIRQAEALAQATADAGRPRIVAGDFNSVTDARIGRLFAERSGLTPAPSFPGTWPANLPGVLGLGIDNVWVSCDLAVVERRLGRRNGSDHRPVVTVLTRARD
jgi:endonuclease/exonuclease/phosphatase (EEP) superfamily protein YafD